MPSHYRIQLYWAGRREGVDGYGDRLHRFTAALAEIHPALRDWRVSIGEERGRAASAAECTAALAKTAEVWELGEDKQTAYELRLYVGHEGAPTAEIIITCGVEQLALGELFAPNKLALWIRRDAPGDLAITSVMHAVLAAAATCFEADFGYVGSATYPAPAVSLYSAGVPPVGWMTYLSTAYPAIPAKLPTPAVGYPVATRGIFWWPTPSRFALTCPNSAKRSRH